MSKLTRDKVIQETDLLYRKSLQLGERLAAIESDGKYGSIDFSEIRYSYDVTHNDLITAKQFTCSNAMDFRRIELGLTGDRSRLTWIAETLDRVERGEFGEQ